MKAELDPPKPPMPDVVITMTWNEAMVLRAKIRSYGIPKGTILDDLFEILEGISK